MQTPYLTSPDGTRFRDLDHDGVMAPFEDPRRSVDARVDDLLPRLSPADKAGLLFHQIMPVGQDGEPVPGTGEQVSDARLTHVNVHQLPSARLTARWNNRLQELAAAAPIGIPVTVSTDPRHGYVENVGVSFAAGVFSQWPEPLGLAALRDPEMVEHFADIARQEYLAVGIRAALHPTLDLATEPRWGRQAGTFGQASALVAEMSLAYLRGLQGTDGIGAGSVACTAKHFPGGGPQKDGEDPHFPYGREQIYPGGAFADHLRPFPAVLAAGVAAVMPYYGMPVGLDLDGERVEEVGFGFNRRIVTGLLRERLGYDGVVVTDWGLLHDAEVMGKPLPARAWGVEELTPTERMAKALEAGVDQFGGECCPELVLDLLESGRLAPQRLDASVRRLLRVKFALGLFDNPFVDEDRAEETVGRADFRAAGERTQSEAVTVLVDRGDTAGPLVRRGCRLYTEGIPSEVASAYGTVVATPSDADVAVVRLAAPYEPRDTLFLEAFFHAGSLDFPAGTVTHVHDLSRSVPVVLIVTLDRPAVLTPLLPHVSGLVVEHGCGPRPLLDALTGAVPPRGRLPFDLPRSMEQVRAHAPDVAGLDDPLFAFGDGIIRPG